MAAAHEIHLRLEDVRPEDTARSAAEVPDKPLIDEMGQYIPKDWPGTRKNVAEMTENILRQANGPDKWPFGDWSKWGGCTRMKLGGGTGYFTKLKKEGRWYLLDPDGYAFYSMGPDCVTARCDGRVDGLESLLSWIPEGPELSESTLRRTMEVQRGPAKLVSFERANLMRAFGENWQEKWQAMVVGQLKRMGMNTLGN